MILKEFASFVCDHFHYSSIKILNYWCKRYLCIKSCLILPSQKRSSVTRTENIISSHVSRCVRQLLFCTVPDDKCARAIFRLRWANRWQRKLSWNYVEGRKTMVEQLVQYTFSPRTERGHYYIMRVQCIRPTTTLWRKPPQESVRARNGFDWV